MKRANIKILNKIEKIGTNTNKRELSTQYPHFFIQVFTNGSAITFVAREDTA